MIIKTVVDLFSLGKQIINCLSSHFQALLSVSVPQLYLDSVQSDNRDRSLKRKW